MRWRQAVSPPSCGLALPSAGVTERPQGRQFLGFLYIYVYLLWIFYIFSPHEEELLDFKLDSIYLINLLNLFKFILNHLGSTLIYIILYYYFHYYILFYIFSLSQTEN